jgi:hypothetical protein
MRERNGTSIMIARENVLAASSVAKAIITGSRPRRPLQMFRRRLAVCRHRTSVPHLPPRRLPPAMPGHWVHLDFAPTHIRDHQRITVDRKR